MALPKGFVNPFRVALPTERRDHLFVLEVEHMAESWRSRTVPNHEARRTERYDLAFRASLRERGASRFTVTVRDLSVTGYKCESSFPLAVGSRVWLTIPGLAPLESIVVWKSEFHYGCAFGAPIHVAVLDHIARQTKTS